MNAAPVIPPAPLRADCPLWLLGEWAEVFRHGLQSRSRILVEVKTPAPRERWLAVVTWRRGGVPLPRVLPAVLRQVCLIPADSANDRRTVGEVFRQMKLAGAPAWHIPLARWGGAAVLSPPPPTIRPSLCSRP